MAILLYRGKQKQCDVKHTVQYTLAGSSFKCAIMSNTVQMISLSAPRAHLAPSVKMSSIRYRAFCAWGAHKV